jgi:hypothetical protein
MYGFWNYDQATMANTKFFYLVGDVIDAALPLLTFIAKMPDNGI